MGFKDLTPEQRTAVARKGGLARRSSELQYAWDNADKIRKEKLGASDLVRKYKISKRSMYRIINGK